MPPCARSWRRAAQAEGWEVLHAELRAVDPESAARIHPNDPQRLIRALEVYRVSGQSMTAHRQRRLQKILPAGASKAALNSPILWRNWPLPRRNDSCCTSELPCDFSLMLEQGLVAEVEVPASARVTCTLGLPSIRAVGYRQVWDYLDGQPQCMQQMQERGMIATRQLAKRQFTWLRGWHGCALAG